MAEETCFIKYVKWGISLTFFETGATYILSVVIHSFFPRRRLLLSSSFLHVSCSAQLKAMFCFGYGVLFANTFCCIVRIFLMLQTIRFIL